MEPPIACTLSPAAYADRTAALATLAARALRSRAATASGERLVFTGTPETERALRRAIAAEAACCAFLQLQLTRRGDTLVLDVTAPESARPLIAELFARTPVTRRGADRPRAAPATLP